MSSGRRARTLVAALGLAAVGAALAVSPATADALGARPSSSVTAAAGTWILRLTPAPTAAPVRGAGRDGGVAASVSAAVRRAGGTVVSVEPALGMLVATLPTGAAAELSAVPGVLSLSPDAKATPTASSYDTRTSGYTDRTGTRVTTRTTINPQPPAGSFTNVIRAIGAQSLWRRGLTGSGVDVALIDTGVAPVPALADKDKVVVGPDLSFESQNPATRYLDTYGHGTHMGSIIAGREVPRSTGDVYAADAKNYYGVAPDARLVSVKVGAHDGAVDVSQLIAAIDWVVQNRTANGLNIKVLNLSFGTDSDQDWTVDPLSQAAEAAVRAGILVVVAGGNEGDKSSGLADPAYNPHVLAVGAVDAKDTDSYTDDAVPSFSQHSDAALADRSPDLVAPGVRIVAPAVPGSTLATTYPGALVGNGAYIRGSGTSQAAAVESGVAALLYQRWPTISPVRMRDLLVTGTRPLSTTTRNYEGAGETWPARSLIDMPLPSDAVAAAHLDLPSATASGTGTLQGARGSQSVTVDGVQLGGETDIFGQPWVAGTMAPLTASFAAWTGGDFNGSTWIGSGFAPDTTTVAGATWSGRTWAGLTWTGNAWSGRSWAGRSWAGRTWAGGTWTGGSWDSTVRPGQAGFAGRTWAGSAWQ